MKSNEENFFAHASFCHVAQSMQTYCLNAPIEWRLNVEIIEFSNIDDIENASQRNAL